MNFGKTESGIFSGRGLDRGDRIEAARKMSFLAHVILLFETTLVGKREAKSDNLPVGSAAIRGNHMGCKMRNAPAPFWSPARSEPASVICAVAS
jgi:hypothetical protein